MGFVQLSDHENAKDTDFFDICVHYDTENPTKAQVAAYRERRHTLLKCHAAMHKNIGRGCEVSRRGFSVIFSKNCRTLGGRSDLSSLVPQALYQIEFAGIDLDAVSERDIEAFCEWQSQKDHEKAIFDAQIKLHWSTGEPDFGDSGSCGSYMHVGLYDGWGVCLCNVRLAGKRSNIQGGILNSPDWEAVRATIKKLFDRFPEYKKASIYPPLPPEDAVFENEDKIFNIL